MTQANSLARLVSRIAYDGRLTVTHISLYMGLLVLWQESGCLTPFRISRLDLMAISKIGSIATYHKRLKELISFGYVRYQPSYHPTKASNAELLTGN
ncbi:hypothetical protein [Hufsiella ginkgonis]|uniref:Transcriptional regulator n=1 Tax=Hufsiella ginkgonis TaxID=2695274 RepID=A0A7K1Y0D0_9SPHI|nr:hypothetical protein [Hufsiella ginkgonis]MXV16537.1 hypothetical protein [Hufsiella ginkgonis]